MTAHAYNAAADYFDAPANSYWTRIGRRTIARLNLKPGDSVLDVGCGAGASAIRAAEIVGPSGKVLGIDLAENLLTLARLKAAGRGLTAVTFQVGDMEHLDFADATFDAVVSVFSIFFVSDMVRQVAEFWRMVKPGGKLAITTWGDGMFSPIYEVWRQAVCSERANLFTAFNCWDRINTVEAVRQLMRDGGVTDVEVIAEDSQQPIRCSVDVWAIAMGSGLRGTIEALEPVAAGRVRAMLINYARETQLKAVATNTIYAVGTKR